MKIITTTFLLLDEEDDLEFIEGLSKSHLIQVRGYQYPNEIGAEGAAAISTALDASIMETHINAVKIMKESGYIDEGSEIQKDPTTDEPSLNVENDESIPPGATIH